MKKKGRKVRDFVGKDADRKRQREWRRKKYKRLSAVGICVRCGKTEATHGMRMCEECREKSNREKREERAFFQSLNICPLCRKKSIEGDEKICPECAAKRRAKRPTYNPERAKIQRAERYQRCKQLRICPVCGKPAAPGRVKCKQCLAKASDSRRAKRKVSIMATWKEDNLCLRCGKPTRPGTSLCEEHYRIAVSSMAKAREKQKMDKR